MGVFAFENGRLVAPPENKISGGVPADVLQAVRVSVLELIERPLFPVGWERQGDMEYLLALDTAGQVITIQVISQLDSETFLACLAQTGRNAERTRSELANIYSGGPINFHSEWTKFVDAAPIRSRRGPRLYLFAATVMPDAVAPLNALRGLGVEGHQIRLHHGAHGELVEIEPIRPVSATLPASARVVEIASSTVTAAPDGTDSQPEPQPEPQSGSVWNITGWGKNEAAETVETAPAARPRFGRRRRHATQSSEASTVPVADSASHPAAATDPNTEEIPSVSAAGARSAHFLTDTGPLPGRDTAEQSNSGDTLYQQLRSALLRPEQRIWEQAAPKETSEQAIFSERASAADSARAVEEAAWRQPELTPVTELASIARQYGAMQLRWHSPRRGIDFTVVLQASGLLKLPDGTEIADPSAAAYRLSGAHADGWRVWRTESGAYLGELR
ncbi:MAG: hypothetical protein Q4E03_02600 [Trueperella sp.]|nr:hypothetical protein [Trueperella sp.]